MHHGVRKEKFSLHPWNPSLLQGLGRAAQGAGGAQLPWHGHWCHRSHRGAANREAQAPPEASQVGISDSRAGGPERLSLVTAAVWGWVRAHLRHPGDPHAGGGDAEVARSNLTCEMPPSPSTAGETRDSQSLQPPSLWCTLPPGSSQLSPTRRPNTGPFGLKGPVPPALVPSPHLQPQGSQRREWA